MVGMINVLEFVVGSLVPGLVVCNPTNSGCLVIIYEALPGESLDSRPRWSWRKAELVEYDKGPITLDPGDWFAVPFKEIAWLEVPLDHTYPRVRTSPVQLRS